MAKARDFALLRPARGAFRSLSVGSAPDLHLPMMLDSGDAPVSRWIVSARVSSSELTACPQGTHAEPGPHAAPSTQLAPKVGRDILDRSPHLRHLS